ncbi:MAG: DnaJ family domain-containing protein [Desulfurispora sp.]|uniref:DnaJ family domain-containing protein n=1 Tax=Desulfurispora sp. TaxID=3014275 RepID=UPI00404A9080
MDIVAVIAEGKIREAIARGELDNLAGSGRPLEIDDLSHVPEELRSGYIMLRNAGVLPEEMQLKKEIVTLQKLIDCCDADVQKKCLQTKLNQKILRFNMLMEGRRASVALSQYRSQLYRRLGG